jgi:hypothetical protein
MACRNCRDFTDNSCPDRTTTNCIDWQGEAHEELDICINDSLTWVTTKIIEKVKEHMKGEGIIFEDLDLAECEWLADLVGNDLDLISVLKGYKDALCELKAGLDANTANLASFADATLYTLGCLDPEDPCGDPYTFKSLIQAIITKLCALNTQFLSIATTILDAIEEGAGNFIGGGAITSCGGNGYSVSGTGASTVVKFEALVPPYCPIIFTGSTANFDSNGVGLPNTPYCGWYLCNGDNGTPNSSTLPQNGGGTITYIIRFT